MKIIDTINFYFGLYPILSICVELNGGIRGCFHTFTKEQALVFLDGFEDEKVVEINFTAHIIFKGEATAEMPCPMLYIKYM